ncbi:hypothetical protein BEWA_022460 [Theileria equi strain WA]|uniref:Uncharacterized protein n=1 Tax=Theileria equi strain WA TaxID=1537102 RepID=L0AW03_THEEQ|nr:hypothetical protein BEWA_022460 [Theileria equi strain WA]AFZ79398.1 hypothetical protein BEWA_022460 [Theileria equi strain WA]|eukprot:XP_004829064.1 hypothetical protein BEWA_022460 [Theileria equi strain WA]
MDFYVNSFASRIPCTRLHRQIQDPRGRNIVTCASSNDGKLLAVVTAPKSPSAIEGSINSLLLGDKLEKASNYFKSVLKQQRIASEVDAEELSIEKYIRDDLNSDSLGSLVDKIACNTSCLEHIIKGGAEQKTKFPEIVPCSIILYDTFYFNPVDEFIYGYKLSTNSTSSNTTHCTFSVESIEFSLDDEFLIITSLDDGAKVYSLEGNFVELVCHFKPSILSKYPLSCFRLMTCEIDFDSPTEGRVEDVSYLEKIDLDIASSLSTESCECVNCKEKLTSLNSEITQECVPYVWKLICTCLFSFSQPFIIQIHSCWPSGSVYVKSIKPLIPLDYISNLNGLDSCIMVNYFKKKILDVHETLVYNSHLNWALEPYLCESTQYLLTGNQPFDDKPQEIKFVKSLGEKLLFAVYIPNFGLLILDENGKEQASATVKEPKSGYQSLKVTHGKFILLIGSESVICFRIVLDDGTLRFEETMSSEDDVSSTEEEMSIDMYTSQIAPPQSKIVLEEILRLPLVAGVGRREEYIDACFGADQSERWLYVSLVCGTSEALLYVVDTTGDSKNVIKKVLNMNSALFPAAIMIEPLNGSILLLPRHNRYIIQMTQEHIDNWDEIFVRGFCHFPALSTNKEMIQLNMPMGDVNSKARPKKRTDITYILDRSLRNQGPSGRLDMAKWLDRHYYMHAYRNSYGSALRRKKPQLPHGYDPAIFYDVFREISLEDSPAKIRAQIYSYVKSTLLDGSLNAYAIERDKTNDPAYAKMEEDREITHPDRIELMEGLKGHFYRLRNMDYLLARICLSRMGNPAKEVLNLSTNEFLLLQLCGLPQIRRRLGPNECIQRFEYVRMKPTRVPQRPTVSGQKTEVGAKQQALKPSVPKPAHPKPVSLQPKTTPVYPKPTYTQQKTTLIQDEELHKLEPHKIRKIIRDRIYRLRQKLGKIEVYKAKNKISSEYKVKIDHEPTMDDCKIPALHSFKDFNKILRIESNIKAKIKALREFILSTKTAT